MAKQLYHLHTPRTGGNFIKESICPVLDTNSLKYYTNDKDTPHDINLSEQVFIAGHWGTYPITVCPDIDVVSVVRNPVHLRASLFTYFYDRGFSKKSEYQRFSSLTDKFKYYVFDDPNFEIHKNMQARFICNSANPIIFDKVLYNQEKNNLIDLQELIEGKAFSWFVRNDNTSLENALNNINSFYSVHAYENLNLTCQDISTWFKQNYNLDITLDINNMVNTGASTLFGGPSSTQEILDGLSSDDILMIESVDWIDKAIYDTLIQ